jgi:hypothetical protein
MVGSLAVGAMFAGTAMSATPVLAATSSLDVGGVIVSWDSQMLTLPAAGCKSVYFDYVNQGSVAYENLTLRITDPTAKTATSGVSKPAPGFRGRTFIFVCTPGWTGPILLEARVYNSRIGSLPDGVSASTQIAFQFQSGPPSLISAVNIPCGTSPLVVQRFCTGQTVLRLAQGPWSFGDSYLHLFNRKGEINFNGASWDAVEWGDPFSGSARYIRPLRRDFKPGRYVILSTEETSAAWICTQTGNQNVCQWRSPSSSTVGYSFSYKGGQVTNIKKLKRNEVRRFNIS